MDIDLIALLMLVAFGAATLDAMAGGGGLITLPALLAAGVPPVAALGTNKLQSSCGTAGATFAFWRKGHIDLRRFAWPALASFAGAAGGAALVQAIDPHFLSGVLPVLLVAMRIDDSPCCFSRTAIVRRPRAPSAASSGPTCWPS